MFTKEKEADSRESPWTLSPLLLPSPHPFPSLLTSGISVVYLYNWWTNIKHYYWSYCMACQILVPPSGIEPACPAVELRVLTTGPPGKSWVLWLARKSIVYRNISSSCFIGLWVLTNASRHVSRITGSHRIVSWP